MMYMGPDIVTGINAKKNKEKEMKDMMLKVMVKSECAIKHGLRKALSRFHREDAGAGVAEYAMVVGLAVIVGVVALGAFWDQIQGLFDTIGRIITDEIFARE